MARPARVSRALRRHREKMPRSLPSPPPGQSRHVPRLCVRTRDAAERGRPLLRSTGHLQTRLSAGKKNERKKNEERKGEKRKAHARRESVRLVRALITLLPPRILPRSPRRDRRSRGRAGAAQLDFRLLSPDAGEDEARTDASVDFVGGRRKSGGGGEGGSDPRKQPRTTARVRPPLRRSSYPIVFAAIVPPLASNGSAGKFRFHELPEFRNGWPAARLQHSPFSTHRCPVSRPRVVHHTQLARLSNRWFLYIRCVSCARMKKEYSARLPESLNYPPILPPRPGDSSFMLDGACLLI